MYHEITKDVHMLINYLVNYFALSSFHILPTCPYIQSIIIGTLIFELKYMLWLHMYALTILQRSKNPPSSLIIQTKYAPGLMIPLECNARYSNYNFMFVAESDQKKIKDMI